MVSEAIQTILRREGYPHPYEELKKLTRNNKKIDREVFINFINSLNINKNIKEELKKLIPIITLEFEIKKTQFIFY